MLYFVMRALVEFAHFVLKIPIMLTKPTQILCSSELEQMAPFVSMTFVFLCSIFTLFVPSPPNCKALRYHFLLLFLLLYTTTKCSQNNSASYQSNFSFFLWLEKQQIEKYKVLCKSKNKN